MEINPRVVQAQYAVRGVIPTRAHEIEDEIKKNKAHAHPFEKLVFCNIGNPQALRQQPLSYARQVMALVDCPALLENTAEVQKLFPADIIARAKEYIAAGWNGAYTHSLGAAIVRDRVCAYIQGRDDMQGAKVANTNIFLTDGASTGAKLILQCLIGSDDDAVMIPIPQYPLYSACLTLLGGSQVNYYLDEDAGWGLDIDSMKASYDAAIKAGKNVKAIVVINPGNPTGQVLDVQKLYELAEFAHDRNMLIIADEVYQENVYYEYEDKPFVSCHRAVRDMPLPYREKTMVFSLHSTSKGVLGECGRRGGYAHLANIPQELYAQIMKLASINLCSNLNGQLMTDLMVRPPQPDDESYHMYRMEYYEIFDSLVRRAKALVDGINKIPGLHSQTIEGAMYAFPKLTLPAKFIAYNEEMNTKEGTSMQPDARWCLQLLEKTGIVVVPGSGFGQVEGTWHFRITILPPEEDLDGVIAKLGDFQREFFAEFE